MQSRIVGKIKTDWSDMSPYLVHMTGGIGSDPAPSNSLSILSMGCIKARNRFGIGKKYPECAPVVCFSEVPLHLIKRLAEKRSPYGIGFKKEFVVQRGGGPIMYAYKDTPHALAVEALVKQAIGKSGDPIWKLAPFIDVPGKYGSAQYFWEWEREWRLPGDLEFSTEDPSFLILPENMHSTARHFLDDAEESGIGPNYICPLIDATWSLERVRAAITDAQSN